MRAIDSRRRPPRFDSRGAATHRRNSSGFCSGEIARHLLGEDWLANYVKAANAGGVERVLL